MLYADPFLTVYCCLLAALLGACMGSFLNCAAWRIVHGESVLRGRSHCDTCGHVLAVRDLIPVVSYLAVVLNAAEQAGKPVFGSEVEQVALGCAGAEGLDYVALGRQTGEMAARVLNGESAESISFETIRDSALYLNTDVLSSLGLEIPAAMAERGYTDMAE